MEFEMGCDLRRDLLRMHRGQCVCVCVFLCERSKAARAKRGQSLTI